MKTVVILGAGASRDAGAPIMTDFIQRMDRLRALLPESERVSLELVDSALSRLQAVFAKSSIDNENIETLMGALDMAMLLGRFPGTAEEKIPELRTALSNAIVQTLEHSLSVTWTSHTSQWHLPAPWDRLTQLFSNAVKSGTVPDCAFISFNYDVLLELALELAEADVPVFKLHGSINWSVCPKCGEIGKVSMMEWLKSKLPYVTGRSDGVIPINVGSDLYKFTHNCGANYTAGPFIVPPTWNKGGHYQPIAAVWKDAAEHLSTAQNIVIVGYSMPGSDEFFRYLFSLGTVSATRIRSVLIVNPDVAAAERIKVFLGTGISKDVIHHTRANFNEGYSHVAGLLTS